MVPPRSRPTDPTGSAPLSSRLLTELERVAVEVACAAAALVHDGRPRDLAPTTKTSDTDLVTVMDTRAESLVRERLAALRPDDGLLGEEGSRAAGSSGITWVLDPIDGTTNYLYGLPLYAVSLAAAIGSPPAPGWRPVAGAVVAPALHTRWSARLGGGARRVDTRHPDEVPVRVGDAVDLPQALLGTGFGYRPAARARQAQLLAHVLPRVRDLRRLGSAATDLCLVADGRLDAYYESGLNPWDLAAGWLVVTEAGGLVTGPDGADPDDRLTVAANPALHPQLVALLGAAAAAGEAAAYGSGA